MNDKRFKELKKKKREENQIYRAAKDKGRKVPKKVVANKKKNKKIKKSAAEYEREYIDEFWSHQVNSIIFSDKNKL